MFMFMSMFMFMFMFMLMFMLMFMFPFAAPGSASYGATRVPLTSTWVKNPNASWVKTNVTVSPQE
jgi:hypothetical protein